MKFVNNSIAAILAVIIILALLTGCGKVKHYEFAQPIENITGAAIVNITDPNEFLSPLNEERYETIAILGQEDAQELAEKTAALNAHAAAPPVNVIAGLTVMLRYADGSAEYVSAQCGMYYSDGRQKYINRFFDGDGFEKTLDEFIRN